MAIGPEKEEIPQGDPSMAMRPEKEEIPQGDTFMAMRPEKEEIMKIGFIGCGNMASAMIGGILKKQVASPEEILASARTEASRRKAEEAFGIAVTEDNRRVAAFADLLILAVKPFYYQEVIAEIKDSVRQETVVVSITPGKTLAWLEEQFGRPMRLVRTMPNTPALVGEAMSCVCGGSQAGPEDVEMVCRVFEGFGKTEIVTEELIDVVVGASGSAPAYVFLFIEAVADGAVAEGMSRAQAYRFAAQAVLGSAKMVLETGIHPGQLKDMGVLPPGNHHRGSGRSGRKRISQRGDGSCARLHPEKQGVLIFCREAEDLEAAVPPDGDCGGRIGASARPYENRGQRRHPPVCASGIQH